MEHGKRIKKTKTWENKKLQQEKQMKLKLGKKIKWIHKKIIKIWKKNWKDFLKKVRITKKK